MSSTTLDIQDEQQRHSPDTQRPGPDLSNLITNPNHANAPGYTKLGPPKNLLKPIQPSASYNSHITLPPVTTDNSLDQDIEPAGQAVSGQRWEVRPRPRPGRKLATDAPDTKRKQQNREAQRAFRERRAQRVSELEAELQKVKNEHRQNIALLWQHCEEEKSEFTKKWREEFGGVLEDDKTRMSDQLRQKDEELLRKDAEVQYWKDKAQKTMGIDTQLTPPPYGSNLGQSFSNTSPSSIITPSAYPSMANMANMAPPAFPRGSFSDQIFGPTNFRANIPDAFGFRPNLPDPRTAHQGARNTTSAAVSAFGSTPSASVTESCGNCTEDNCPCVDELVDDSNANIVRHPSAANPPISPTDARTFANPDSAVDLSAREIDFTSTGSRQTAQQASGPGSCANCQANPDQKRFCQTLHQAARHAEQPRQMKEKDSVAGQMLPPALRLSIGSGRMSCDETYNVLFPNRNFSVDSSYSDFVKDLLTLPPSRRDSGMTGVPQRTALDVECASVLDYMRSSGSISASSHVQHPMPSHAQNQPQGGTEQEPGDQIMHVGGRHGT
ncbi:MAG: hypothetical protein M1821_002174 [Bathelium mastoideum]|nr:MAG: hypothetical protein M1821_002174 [Bathelium mastoideum]